MRLINADALEVVGTIIPSDIDTKSYVMGMAYILNKIDSMPTIEPERKKDTIQKFHDYQIEWLKSHYDIVLEPQLEEMIIRFLHDTANSYMMDIDRREGEN